MAGKHEWSPLVFDFSGNRGRARVLENAHLVVKADDDRRKANPPRHRRSDLVTLLKNFIWPGTP